MGCACRFLGVTPEKEAQMTQLEITPTKTRFTSEFGGVRLETCFVTPACRRIWI